MVKLDNFKRMPFLEKKEMLQNLEGKRVKIFYDYTDIPGGDIGPVVRIGTIMSVEDYTKVRIQPDNTSSMGELWTIDGILELEELESLGLSYSFGIQNKKGW